MLKRSWKSHGGAPASVYAAVLLLFVSAWDARANVNVALAPFAQSVAPGSDFDVFVDISTAASPFNGFSFIVSYDPAALTLLPTSPTSLQQGCLMTGVCSAACGNTFHQFAAAGDSIDVHDLLLCNLVTITGPGHLYKLRFHASNTPQVSYVRIRRTAFYNAGVRDTLVKKVDCVVAIGTSLGVGENGFALGRPVRVEPNPAFGRVRFVSEDDTGGLVQADIMDLQGRVVRHLGPLWLGPRARFEWDGADASGARAPAGLYMINVRRGDRTQNSRFVLLK